MRLSYFEWGLDLVFEENRVNVLILEQPQMFAAFLEKIQLQYDGAAGELQLSQGEKQLPIGKNVEIVYTPLLIELNGKKILSHLHQEMKNISDEYYFAEKERVNSMIVSYLDGVAAKLPYPISFDLEMDPVAVFKLYGARLDYDNVSMLEKLENYVQLQRLLCGTKLIIFVNLKAYLDEDQLRELYSHTFYNKMHLLLIEASESSCLKGENYYIIDRDKCLIRH